jgi:hypothetical protein
MYDKPIAVFFKTKILSHNPQVHFYLKYPISIFNGWRGNYNKTKIKPPCILN